MRKLSEQNRKYLTIFNYAVFLVLISTFIIKAIMDWDSVNSVFSYIFKILSPFLIGFVVAYILNPLVNWFMRRIFDPLFKKRKKKTNLSLYLSLFLTYTLVIGMIVVLLIVIIPQIYSSLLELTSQITSQYFKIMDQLSNAPETWHNIPIDYIMGLVNNAVPQLVAHISNFTTNLIPFFFNTSLSLIKGFWNVIIGLIISVYMVADRENLSKNLSRFLFAVVPAKGSAYFLKASSESARIFRQYVVGKTLDSLIIGLITFIAMTLLQLDFKLLISILIGITNMIPYFGPFFGGAVGIVILLIESPVKALIFAALILVIQQFDGLYLGPKILGESTGLKPLWVIFGITVGGSMFGILGMLIGVPTVAVLSYILNTFIEYRLKSRSVTYRDGKAVSISNNEE